MKKKLITATLLSVAALALVVASVLGTIAFLTSSSKVSNVFTVGKVSIEMTEALVDENGDLIEGRTTERTDRNSYHLVPGQDYIKDPTIFIKNDLNNNDNMYLFVKSSNGIRWIEEGNFDDDNEDNDNNSMRKQMENNGWIPVLRSKDGMEIVWVYGTRTSAGVITPTAVNKTSQQIRKTGENTTETGAAGEFRLCSEFTIHPDADVSIYGGASVDFTAYAVQTNGLTQIQNPTGNQIAKAAWDAIKASISYEHGIANPVNPYDASEEPFAVTPGEFTLDNTTNPGTSTDTDTSDSSSDG